jgi:hypothetical protein
MITVISGLAIPFGSIVSFTMTGTIFSSTGGQSDKVIEAFSDLIKYQNIWVTLAAIPFIFIIRNSPKSPPSLVAT